MTIIKLNVGYLMTNCYIAADEASGQAVVIDPGGDAGKIMSAIEKTGTKVKYILLTHGHYDHTGAADEVSRLTGAPVYIHPADLLDDAGDFGTQLFYAPAKETPIKHLAEGDVLTLGSHEIKVLNTTRPQPGQLCLSDGPGDVFRRHPVCRQLRPHGFYRRQHRKNDGVFKAAPRFAGGLQRLSRP
jgi:glyoxylase-like metal-dependent hydrolase (beta-lactamase superfamily II)